MATGVHGRIGANVLPPAPTDIDPVGGPWMFYPMPVEFCPLEITRSRNKITIQFSILCAIFCLFKNGMNNFRKLYLYFSRMRSEGSRFIWGSGGEAVFAESCVYVRNRPQPSATVRNRAQPSA